MPSVRGGVFFFSGMGGILIIHKAWILVEEQEVCFLEGCNKEMLFHWWFEERSPKYPERKKRETFVFERLTESAICQKRNSNSC